MKSRILDRLCAAIFFVFGLFLLISIPMYTNAAKYDPVGSRFFPYAIAVCVLIVSAILAYTTIKGERYKISDSKEENVQINKNDIVRTVLFCLILFVMLILIEKVHFLAGGAVMLTSMLMLCKVKKISRYLLIYACTIVIYYVFTKYFNIRL